MDNLEDLENISKKSFATFSIMVFSLIMFAGLGISQASGTGDVVLDSNGIQLNTGTLDVNGNDIEDSGTTIWDQSAGEIPDAVLGIDLSTNAGNDLTWDSNNNEFDVDSGSIQSGTSASDVGLGSADNADELDLDGSESMSGTLDLGTNDIIDVGEIRGISEMNSNGDDLSVNGVDVMTSESGAGSADTASTFGIWANKASDEMMWLRSNDVFRISVDDDNAAGYELQLDKSGNLDVDGNKNWVHDLGNGSEAVYTSQESPEVRAVYEGQTKVTNGKVNVSLPTHFSETVSELKPMLRVQATAHDLANVAVTERTGDYLVIEASNDVKVDYRVTGIREGNEDKQVVRPVEE